MFYVCGHFVGIFELSYFVERYLFFHGSIVIRSYADSYLRFLHWVFTARKWYCLYHFLLVSVNDYTYVQTTLSSYFIVIYDRSSLHDGRVISSQCLWYLHGIVGGIYRSHYLLHCKGVPCIQLASYFHFLYLGRYWAYPVLLESAYHDVVVDGFSRHQWGYWCIGLLVTILLHE